MTSKNYCNTWTSPQESWQAEILVSIRGVFYILPCCLLGSRLDTDRVAFILNISARRNMAEAGLNVCAPSLYRARELYGNTAMSRSVATRLSQPTLLFSYKTPISIASNTGYGAGGWRSAFRMTRQCTDLQSGWTQLCPLRWLDTRMTWSTHIINEIARQPKLRTQASHLNRKSGQSIKNNILPYKHLIRCATMRVPCGGLLQRVQAPRLTNTNDK
jgi:hypothetical protein